MAMTSGTLIEIESFEDAEAAVREYDEAVKEHGHDSPQARDARRYLRQMVHADTEAADPDTIAPKEEEEWRHAD